MTPVTILFIGVVALSGFRAFLKRKNIEISLRRYGIDALGAMAQGLFCSLLIGTILNTLGSQTGVAIFSTVGGYATAVSGPAMAVAIGYALKCPPLVLFSMVPVRHRHRRGRGRQNGQQGDAR